MYCSREIFLAFIKNSKTAKNYTNQSQLGMIFPPSGCLAMSEDIFGYHNWEMLLGIHWIESRDAAKHLLCTRLSPTKKSYPAQDVSSAEVEKPWTRLSHIDG